MIPKRVVLFRFPKLSVRARRLAVAILCGLVAGLALSPTATARPGIPIPGPGGDSNGKIVFSSNRGGSFQIYVMNADGSGQSQVTNGFERADGASWSPDGTKIAFMGTNAASDPKVYVMNADGSGQKPVEGPSQNFDAAAWSPDGQRLAYSNGVTIFVVNAIPGVHIDDVGPRRLNPAWTGSMAGPSWSPDGMRVAFEGLSPSPERKFGIFVANADGTGTVRRLTDRPDTSAGWFPGSARIAFNRAPLGGGLDIFVMNADGSAPTNVTKSNTSENDVALSPDGQKFVFHGNVSSVNNLDIYAMNVDGTGTVRLTTDAGSDIHPNWQALNRRIDASVSEGNPPTILCGPGDKAWTAGEARVVCNPRTRLPVKREPALG